MSESHINKNIALDTFKTILSSIPCKNHFKIHQCYNVRVGVNWQVTDRVKDDLFMVFIRDGYGKYIIGTNEEPMEPGKIIFISSNMRHSIKADPKNPPSFISIHFGIYENFTNDIINLISEPFYLGLSPEDMTQCIALFEDANHYFTPQEGPLHYAMMSSTITQIIGKTLECIELSHNHVSANDVKITWAKEYMENNLLQSLKIDELAQLSGFSRKYFSTLFKKRYAMTPKEYHIMLRIHYSRFLLEQANMSVKEVAATLGYPDPYTFSRQFKKVTGLSPSTITVTSIL